jgi:hypothetical protein
MNLLTPWFKTDNAKPVHKGWYLTTAMTDDSPYWWVFSQWDGKKWNNEPTAEPTYWRGVTTTEMVPPDAFALIVKPNGASTVLVPGGMKDSDPVPVEFVRAIKWMGR